MEVAQSIQLGRSEIFICKIRNSLAAKELADESISVEERMKMIAPIVCTGTGRYYSVNPDPKGAYEDWKDLFKKV